MMAQPLNPSNGNTRLLNRLTKVIEPVQAPDQPFARTESASPPPVVIAPAPAAPMLPSISARHSWKILVQLDKEPLAALRLEITQQVSVGRADAVEGFTPGFDLSPYGALDAGVSRRHAVMYIQDNALYVRDMGSTNGTRINGKLVEPQRGYKVSDGDELVFGQLRCKLKFVSVPA